MGWADVFPILDDSLVARYQALALASDKDRLRALYAVDEIFSQRPCDHIASISLFWKPMRKADPDDPRPSRRLMEDPAAHGLPTRFKNHWACYVEPIFRAAKIV